MTLVSIVIPMFNQELNINRTINSCLKQNLKNIEIIIVDDGSNDKSFKIIKQFTAQDSRIKIYQNKENYGTLHARIKGVLNATGEFIIFLDADDELLPEACDKVYFTMKKNKVDFLSFGVKGLIKNNLLNSLNHLSPQEQIINNKSFRLGTPGKAYSRLTLKQSLSKLELKENHKYIYAEDVLLLFVFFIYSKRICSIPDILYDYKYNHNSISNDNTEIRNKLKLDQILHNINIVKNHDIDRRVENKKKFRERFLQSLYRDYHYLNRKKINSYIKYILLTFTSGSYIIFVAKLFLFVITLGCYRK